MKLIAILLMMFFLHSGIAHALTDCFGNAHGMHEPTQKLDIGDSANRPGSADEEPASIHCADQRLQVGPMVQSSAESLSKRYSVKHLSFAWMDSAAHPYSEQSGARPKALLLASISPQFHTPVYIAVSVLRI